MRLVPLCILALVCTGCPQRYVTRTVVLAARTGEVQNSQTISVERREVQTALKIIDAVLVSHGFARTEDPNLTVAGSLVTYSNATADGLTLIDPCPSVSLKDERLVFRIAERGHLSEDSKRMFKTIKTELRNHYGAERVTTGR